MLALAGGLVLALTGFSGRIDVARADTAPDNNANPYFSLSVDPAATQNLVDGQAIPFTVTRTDLGTSTGLEIAAVGTGWCQSDVQLPISEDPGNQSFNSLTTGFPVVNATTPGAPPANCLDYVNSDLSGIVSNGSSLPTIAPQPNSTINAAGGEGDYPTVSGQTLAEVGQGGQQPLPFNGISVNCLPSAPCTLALAVWTVNVMVPGQNSVYFLGVPVSFQSSSAGLACNGPAPGQVASESPDRLGETVTQWGIDACQSGLASGQSLTFNLGSSNSDDEALCAFASGSVDLSYSAVGYGEQGSGFSPSNCQGGAQPPRAYVAIPVGLNAIVLGHSPNDVQSPPFQSFGTGLTHFSQLKITIAQFAQLLSNGGYVDVSASGAQTNDTGTWTSQLGQGILALNPELAHAFQDSCSGCVIVGTGSGVGVAATSGTDATTYLVSRFLDALVPGQLVSAPNHQADSPPQQLGTTTNFGAPPPAYDVQTYTGRSILAHYMTPLSGTAWWTVTDAATAAATWGGVDDFALQAPDSLTATSDQATYVAPTVAAMQAAVANMTAQPDGTLLPDPQGGAVNGVEPYPLTYVEYAIAPAAPLMNADCTPNTSGQTDLSQWLTFLVGPGQNDLPAGMAQLPSSLVTQAQADIAQVGSAAAACSPSSSVSSSSAASSGGAASPGAPLAFGSAPPAPFDSLLSFLGAEGASAGSASSASKGGGAPGSPSKGASRPAPLSLAAFEAVTPASWLFPLLGVLVLALLLPGLVLLASGRSLTEVLGGLRSGAHPSVAQSPDPAPQQGDVGGET
ncbi:MAG TPA: hypothetical protein VHX67_03175 [Acidimicrobiales bacterium]|nr:hypothetical protein [Acidimicrobiales bacterium]